jgi:hypothetical protein
MMHVFRFYLKARDNLFLDVPSCSLNDTSQRELRAHLKGSGMKEKTAFCVQSHSSAKNAPIVVVKPIL